MFVRKAITDRTSYQLQQYWNGFGGETPDKNRQKARCQFEPDWPESSVARKLHRQFCFAAHFSHRNQTERCSTNSAHTPSQAGSPVREKWSSARAHFCQLASTKKSS